MLAQVRWQRMLFGFDHPTAVSATQRSPHRCWQGVARLVQVLPTRESVPPLLREPLQVWGPSQELGHRAAHL